MLPIESLTENDQYPRPTRRGMKQRRTTVLLSSSEARTGPTFIHQLIAGSLSPQPGWIARFRRWAAQGRSELIVTCMPGET